jgi:hypothetical protein
MIIILWLLIGLVVQMAREEHVPLHWAWWPVLVALGPVIPVLALEVELWRVVALRGEKWQH